MLSGSVGNGIDSLKNVTQEAYLPMLLTHSTSPTIPAILDPPKKKRKRDHPRQARSKKNSMHHQSNKNPKTEGLGILLALEPRIMFDGAAFMTGAEVVQEQITQDLDIQNLNVEIEPETFSNPFTDPIDLFSALSSVTAPSVRQEIIFIDTSVDDYQTLLLGIDPSAEAILLDATRDGIEQIAEILSERSDIDAIHLIAEGNAAELHLGTTFLTQESIIGKYANLLTQIGQSLSANADLLIYGCNFGQGETGLGAMKTLAELTGADLAASTDRTGHVSEYANWELEVATGFIETSVIIGEATQEAWEGVLATFTVTNTNDAGAGSLRQAIIDANAAPGTDTIVIPTGTYLLTSGQLQINGDTIVTGAGAATTIIDGNNTDRVFETLGSNTVTMNGLTIQNGNQNNGGGIFVNNSSILNLSDATLTGNNNNGSGNAGSGGAIHVHGTANLNRVLLSGNTAATGGGIGFHGATGGSLTNVTISGNTSTGNGGGVDTDTAIPIKNSTITLNNGNNGGGIFANGTTVTISNTIVSDNIGNSTNADVQGNFNSDGFNLIKDISGATGFGSDITGVSANLGILADNGGPTHTHALLGGSLAINAGTTTGAPTVDQRGAARDANVDIGAFEASSSTTPTIDLDLDNSSGATGNDFQFSFTEGDSSTAIADSDADLNDLDSSTFTIVKLAISGLLDGNTEVLVLDGDTFALATAVAGQDTTGGSYHVVMTTGVGTATVAITKQGGGTFTEIETETLIQAIQYQHTNSTTPTDGDRLIDVIVNDGTTDSAAARTTINVNPVNASPVAVTDGFTVIEGSTNTLNLAGNDTDSDDGLDLTSITIIAGPTNGTIDSINAGGTVTYTHNGSETLSDSFTYTINDLAGAASNTVPVSLTVTPQNDAPIITSDGGGASAGITVITGTTAVTDVNATDAEGATLTYSITGGADAALFTIDPNTGVLAFITAPNLGTPSDVGGDNVYDVIVQTSDGTAVASQAIAVTVTNAPVIVLPPPLDPSPEPSPPPDDGDTDEDLPPIGGNIVQHSPGFLSGVSQGSTPDDPKNADSDKKLTGNDLAMVQLNKGGKGLGSTGSELLDVLGQPLGLSTLKSEIQALLGASSGFLKDLDDSRDELNNLVATEKTFLASSVAASTGLSIGYVIWLLRSGVLLTALLSSVPAWQFVNPLLVLGSPAKKKHKKGQEDLEDDSLESMFEQQPHTTETSENPTPVTPMTRLSRWFRRIKL